jgi:hypothetical protein
LPAIYACTRQINETTIVSDGFNPYREWLSLKTSSPNYYELLDLPLQESDAAKIAAAADRAITRVRGFRPGTQAREWARLLDEIRAAKECLLDLDCRTQYEAEQTRAATAEAILPPESPPELEGEALSPPSSVRSSDDLFPSTSNRPAIQANTNRLLTPELPEAIVVATASPASQTWSAGPSPLYGFVENSNASPALPPVAIAIPTSSQTMTRPMAIPEQPALPFATGTQKRATFRTATTPPVKVPRPRGRGTMWGFILLLWLVVAGLTYRLSIVARQRQSAEDSATEVEAKRDLTEPQANSKPPKQAETHNQ